MTHKQLKEEGYRLSRFNMGRKPHSRRYRSLCGYALYDPNGRYLGSIRPVKGRYNRWGAHPRLKNEPVARLRPISDHATVPDAAAAIIRFEPKKRQRRPAVTCPRCGATSKVLYTMGGVQARQCQLGHQFDYDKWMADRLIWAPGAIGSLSKEVTK